MVYGQEKYGSLPLSNPKHLCLSKCVVAADHINDHGP